MRFRHITLKHSSFHTEIFKLNEFKIYQEGLDLSTFVFQSRLKNRVVR